MSLGIIFLIVNCGSKHGIKGYMGLKVVVLGGVVDVGEAGMVA